MVVRRRCPAESDESIGCWVLLGVCVAGAVSGGASSRAPQTEHGTGQQIGSVVGGRSFVPGYPDSK